MHFVLNTVKRLLRVTLLLMFIFCTHECILFQTQLTAIIITIIAIFATSKSKQVLFRNMGCDAPLSHALNVSDDHNNTARLETEMRLTRN